VPIAAAVSLAQSAATRRRSRRTIRPQIRTFRSERPGLRLNEHLEHKDGEIVLEGIVSKRRDSQYRSGGSPDWLKMKNPACAAVKPEEEGDWGHRR
jgi:ATP-dependent DNA ligase